MRKLNPPATDAIRDANNALVSVIEQHRLHRKVEGKSPGTNATKLPVGRLEDVSHGDYAFTVADLKILTNIAKLQEVPIRTELLTVIQTAAAAAGFQYNEDTAQSWGERVRNWRVKQSIGSRLTIIDKVYDAPESRINMPELLGSIILASGTTSTAIDKAINEKAQLAHDARYSRLPFSFKPAFRPSAPLNQRMKHSEMTPRGAFEQVMEACQDSLPFTDDERRKMEEIWKRYSEKTYSKMRRQKTLEPWEVEFGAGEVDPADVDTSFSDGSAEEALKRGRRSRTSRSR